MRNFYQISGTFKDTMNRLMRRHQNDPISEMTEMENQYLILSV